DFSAMISPEMFGEFMVPVLTEMCQRVNYSMYHWDGPGAIPHHDHLLSIDPLPMLQWTPGAGQEPTWHRKWWPMYHKTFDAGKKMLISCDTLQHLEDLRREFGADMKMFLINMGVESPDEAERAMEIASF
ncbi:MAG: hypothetical protein KGZ25_03235, partial [Planctomycetes bacterium]|nr:hypothetical protein [Planctomycetota bacterium]